MLRDLDMAYELCQSLKDDSPCEMCGRCCHQPYITVRDTDFARTPAMKIVRYKKCQ